MEKHYSLVLRKSFDVDVVSLAEALIGGVDEAGRGCVIGPLVVAGVAVKAEALPILAEMGVKDSKQLTPQKRELLYPAILQLAERWCTVKVQPCDIDKAVESTRRLHKLNRLEASVMAQVIDSLKPDAVYVDAADTVEHRFGNHIRECLTVKTRIVSRHKADSTYLVVSAASIVAKVERDREVAALRVMHGDFGSGYLTDEKTVNFLRSLLEKDDDYPGFVRKSWKPAKRVKNEKGTVQKTLT